MTLDRILYFGALGGYLSGIRAEVDDNTRVVHATTIAETRTTLDSEPVDVVIVDTTHVDRPVESIVELTEQYPAVPVVVIVEKSTDPVVVFDSIIGGATDYVERGTQTGQPAQLVDYLTTAVDETAIDGTDGRAEQLVQDEIESRRRTEHRLSTVLERIPNPVFYRDTDGTYLGCNAAFETMFDQPREELIGHTSADIDNELLDMLGEETDDKLAETGENQRVERTISHEDGCIYMRIHKAPFEDVDGDIAGIVGIVEDITEQRRHEQELKEQAENLEILNQVTRHDIRNDLQVILGMTDILREHVDEDGQEYLDTIIENSQHAVDLTQQARDLTEAMLESGHGTEPIPLKSTIESEIEKIQETYNRAVVTVSGTIPNVSVSADGMLSSVFRNILANGIQHNDSDLPRIVISAEASPETVTVRIADNGPGIPDKQKETVFGRGEKGLESSGTGLGLYLVDTLIDKYGGSVSIEDGEDGAEFVLTLQRAER
jgi:PAS domain S-box-containing protein